MNFNRKLSAIFLLLSFLTSAAFAAETTVITIDLSALAGKIDPRFFSTKRATASGEEQEKAVEVIEAENCLYHAVLRPYAAISPQEYSSLYLKHFRRIKQKDPKIKVGPVLNTVEWSEDVLRAIRGRLDFAAMHVYVDPGNHNAASAGDSLKLSLALPEFESRKYIFHALKLLDKYTSQKLPLLITRYGMTGSGDDNCLKSCLTQAELLRVFLLPELRIRGAAYPEGDAFPIQEFYHQNSGEILLRPAVTGPEYDAAEFIHLLKDKYYLLSVKEFEGINLLSKTGRRSYKLTAADGSADNSPLSQTVRVEPGTYRLSLLLKTRGSEKTGFWMEASAENKGWSKSTPIVSGNTGWRAVNVNFAVSESTDLRLSARARGKGRALFKDIRLERSRVVPHREPYLSVTASKSSDDKELYLIIINRHPDRPLTAEIHLPGFQATKAKITTLTAPTPEAEVKAKETILQLDTPNSFEFEFEPRSVTAIAFR